MKKTFLIAAMALMLGAANAQAQEWQPIPGMHLSINEMTHDFGSHPQYTKTEFEFNIKNDSTLALVISNISTSCGCTTPTYSKRPVKSGKIATVKVAYDASRVGIFSKTIYVYTNFSTEPIELNIKGTMEETENKE